jgi:predicted RNA polymerase sigma factor
MKDYKLLDFNEMLPYSFIFCSNMASQNPSRDPTMHIPKDIFPQFESLKIALGKESKSDVLRWVFAMCAPHIQATLRSVHVLVLRVVEPLVM